MAETLGGFQHQVEDFWQVCMISANDTLAPSSSGVERVPSHELAGPGIPAAHWTPAIYHQMETCNQSKAKNYVKPSDNTVQTHFHGLNVNWRIPYKFGWSTQMVLPPSRIGRVPYHEAAGPQVPIVHLKGKRWQTLGRVSSWIAVSVCGMYLLGPRYSGIAIL